MPIRHSIRPPLSVRGPTVGRLAAAERVLKRERTRLALFVREVLTEQEGPDERIRRYDEWLAFQEHQHRQLAAQQWRRGRELLNEAPQEARKEIMAAWNGSSIPADAAYFADFVWRVLRDRSLLPTSPDDDA